MDSPSTINTPRGTLIELPIPESGDFTNTLFTAASTQERIQAITCTPIDFSQTALPIYEPYFAVVLDDVFTAEECAILRVVPDGHWSSLVQGNAFREVDRTLVLNTQIASVLYERVRSHLEAAAVTRLRRPMNTNLATASNVETHPGQESEQHDWSAGIAGTNNLKGSQGKHKATWDMYGANERLSFLRYGPGMHHDRHCDQVFSRPGMGKDDKSFLTCQVYLSDSSSAESVDGFEQDVIGDQHRIRSDQSQGAEEGASVGGTTRFWGPPGTEFENRIVDVVPKVGRVLVFQQRMLWHSGQPVLKGLKYAMRTDLMYKRIFT